jgi:uncharacterized protein DUF664
LTKHTVNVPTIQPPKCLADRSGEGVLRRLQAEMDRCMADGADVQLRDVLVAQIAKYARHCSHADLLHERIDGRVGQ